MSNRYESVSLFWNHFTISFLFPSSVGHGLKSLDLVCMKKLDTKVNIIPIIAKADTISKTELQRFKVSFSYFFVSNKSVRLLSRPKLIKSCPPMVYKYINFPLMMKLLPKSMYPWIRMFLSLLSVQLNLFDLVTKRFELDNIHGEQFKVCGICYFINWTLV